MEISRFTDSLSLAWFVCRGPKIRLEFCVFRIGFAMICSSNIDDGVNDGNDCAATMTCKALPVS